MRMYGLWTLLLATINLVVCGPPDISLLQGESSAYCVIANETESTPITLTNNQRPVSASEYIQYPNTSFCKISTDRRCGKELENGAWKYDNSSNYDLVPIADRRWEDLDFTKTGEIDFVNIHNVSKDEKDFNFVLFVKMKTDASVYMCDGTFPPTSNCYWFVIGDKDGSETVARKCEKNTLSGEENKHRQESNCALLNKLEFNVSIDLKTFTKFKFNKTGNRYSIKHQGQNVLTCADEKVPHFEIKHIMVASPVKTPGMWKMNNSNDPTIYRTGQLHSISLDKNTKRYSFSTLHYGDKQQTIYIYLCQTEDYDPSCYTISFKLPDAKRETNLESPWNHFTLKVERPKYTVVNNRNESLFEFSNNSINPKHVLIDSDGLVYWKIHSYGLLTAKESGSTSLKLNNAKKDQSICIAIFVQAGEKCNLTLELRDEQGAILVTKVQSNKNVWEEIKLTTTLDKDTKPELNVQLSTEDNDRAFIGDIRDCSKNLRVIGVTTKDKSDDISCKSMMFPKIQTHSNEKASTALSHDNKTIEVIWLNTDGKERYALRTELKYSGCNDPNDDMKEEHKGNNITESLSSTLLNISPYTTFNIRLVDEKNTQVFLKSFNFPATDTVTSEEIPQVVCKQIDDTILVNLTLHDCTKIKGSLHYYVLPKCMWCNDSNPVMQEGKPGTVTAQLKDVFGRSHYTIMLGIFRTSRARNVTYKEICNINTSPTAPPRVPNVTVYSKTNNSISIRWKKPYPDTGELEKYVIEYNGKEKDWSHFNISISVKCKVWPDYICATINNLTQHTNYKIRVRAKNKDVEALSYVKSPTETVTKEEVPKPPENITFSWDDRLNLTVTCAYPSDAIGPVRKLHVHINDKEFRSDVNVESRSYSVQINATEFSARSITIKVTFSNAAGTSGEVTKIIDSPPKTPKIHEKLIQRTGDVIYVNTSFLDNLDGKSEIFIFQGNSSAKYNALHEDICKHFHVFSSETLVINATIKNASEKIDLCGNFTVNTEEAFILFLRNNHAGIDRCALHTSPLTLIEDVSSSGGNSYLTWTLVILFLFCLSTGIVFYLYKKQKFTYKPAWLSAVTSRKGEHTTLEMDDVEKVEFSRSVPTEQFEAYVTRALDSSELLKQYTAVENLDAKSHVVGLMPENLRKNRYKNIIAYDETRVILQSLYSNGSDEYINANYVKGFNKEKAYIATQGPTTVTLDDFWRMIWQENVECIVMLSRLMENGKNKSEQYWPVFEEVLRTNTFKITCAKVNTTDDITIRTLMLSFNGSERQVIQIHYEGWLDKKVPSSIEGLQNVLRLMEDFENHDKPTVVHSSAGVGRTGTLILSEIAIKTGRVTRTVDMLSILHKLRQQRLKMVATFEQYHFAHVLVLDVLEPTYHYIV